MMEPGIIWWDRIGTGLQYVEAVTEALRDQRSTVLQIPHYFPWKQAFYRKVDIERSPFGAHRGLVRRAWDGGDVGEFVLEQFCSRETRSEYWPMISVAKYLASLEDILLCDYYVWITGIRTQQDLDRWAQFVHEYESCATMAQRAVFILEYTGDHRQNLLPVLPYEVTRVDCRILCLEMAEQLRNAKNDDYLAEMALSIGGGDPEFSVALLQQGDALCADPCAAVQTVAQTCRHSSGAPFASMTQDQILSAAWKAALVLLFPAVESFRMEFISRHEGTLSYHLPISDSNGQEITTPRDLEIGTLWHLVTKRAKGFTPAQTEQVTLCRNVRNKLAHLDPVPYEDALKVLKL